MGCTTTKDSKIQKYILQRFADTIDKISPEELNILKIIYFDLALRNAHKKIQKETFFVFFQKNGLWGHRLFKQFDMDNSDFVCLEEFIFSTAKIIKADQDTKIGLLYQFFAFGNKDKNDGIVYSDFLRVLYNYSKQELKSILQAEYLTGSDLKQELIDVLQGFEQTNPNYNNDQMICLEMKEKADSVFGSNIYQYLNPNDLDKRKVHMGSFIGKPIKTQLIASMQLQNHKKISSIEIQNMSRSSIDRKNHDSEIQKDTHGNTLSIKNKKIDNLYRQSGMFLRVNNKKVTIKTGSYHAIVKKVAGLIFNHFKIDKKNGRLFEDQFVQWIKLHKDLYESYYRGFNQHIWQMKDGKPKYLSEVPEMQSKGVYSGQIFVKGEQTEKKLIKECKIFLQNSILFITEYQNKQHLYNIVCLEGLQVASVYQQKLGYGIQIRHKNNIYPKKNIFFSSEIICKKWMEHLKDYKGFNLHEKYEVGMQIGAGKYSIVYECKQRQNKKRYAMKQIDTFRLTSEEKSIISHESHIMGVFHHPNLLRFRQSLKTKNKIFIITELVEGKDLSEYVKERQVLSQKQVLQLSKQIIHGVNYLHHLGIVHRDLKPQNIMIQSKPLSNLQVKIIDFGFANYITNFEFLNEGDPIIGTPNYIAPEIYLKKKITQKADIFSIGTIIYFMLSGELPFNSDNLQFLVERTLTEECQFVGKRWMKISKEAKEFIKLLLEVDAEKRISLEDALNHDWFKIQNPNRKSSETIESRKEILPNSRKAILF